MSFHNSLAEPRNHETERRYLNGKEHSAYGRAKGNSDTCSGRRSDDLAHLAL
jgi:hypothetical protein